MMAARDDPSDGPYKKTKLAGVQHADGHFLLQQQQQGLHHLLPAGHRRHHYQHSSAVRRLQVLQADEDAELDLDAGPSPSPGESLELLQRLELGDQGSDLHAQDLHAVGQALLQVQVAGDTATTAGDSSAGKAVGSYAAGRRTSQRVALACQRTGAAGGPDRQLGAAAPQLGTLGEGRMTGAPCGHEKQQPQASDPMPEGPMAGAGQQGPEQRGSDAQTAALPSQQQHHQQHQQQHQQQQQQQHQQPADGQAPPAQQEAHTPDPDAVEVFIGGLGPDCNEAVLRDALQGLAASILSVKVQLTRTHGRCKGYAFVTFSDAAAVAQAQRTVREVGGQRVALHLARACTAEQLQVPLRGQDSRAVWLDRSTGDGPVVLQSAGQHTPEAPGARAGVGAGAGAGAAARTGAGAGLLPGAAAAATATAQEGVSASAPQAAPQPHGTARAPGPGSLQRLLHIIRRHQDPEAAVAAALAVAWAGKRPAPSGGNSAGGGGGGSWGGPAKRPAIADPGGTTPVKATAAGGTPGRAAAREAAAACEAPGGGVEAAVAVAAVRAGARTAPTAVAAAATPAPTASASAADSWGGEGSVSASVSLSVAASGCGTGGGTAMDGAEGPTSRLTPAPSRGTPPAVQGLGLAALLEPYPETRRALALFRHTPNVTPLTILNNQQNRLGWEVSFLEEAIAPTGPFNAVATVIDPGPPRLMLAMGKGKGRTKKDAKQLAAAAVLEDLLPTLGGRESEERQVFGMAGGPGVSGEAGGHASKGEPGTRARVAGAAGAGGRSRAAAGSCRHQGAGDCPPTASGDSVERATAAAGAAGAADVATVEDASAAVSGGAGGAGGMGGAGGAGTAGYAGAGAGAGAGAAAAGTGEGIEASPEPMAGARQGGIQRQGGGDSTRHSSGHGLRAAAAGGRGAALKRTLPGSSSAPPPRPSPGARPAPDAAPPYPSGITPHPGGGADIWTGSSRQQPAPGGGGGGGYKAPHGGGPSLAAVAAAAAAGDWLSRARISSPSPRRNAASPAAERTVHVPQPGAVGRQYGHGYGQREQYAPGSRRQRLGEQPCGAEAAHTARTAHATHTAHTAHPAGRPGWRHDEPRSHCMGNPGMHGHGPAHGVHGPVGDVGRRFPTPPGQRRSGEGEGRAGEGGWLPPHTHTRSHPPHPPHPPHTPWVPAAPPRSAGQQAAAPDGHCLLAEGQGPWQTQRDSVNQGYGEWQGRGQGQAGLHWNDNWAGRGNWCQGQGNGQNQGRTPFGRLSGYRWTSPDPSRPSPNPNPNLNPYPGHNSGQAPAHGPSHGRAALGASDATPWDAIGVAQRQNPSPGAGRDVTAVGHSSRPRRYASPAGLPPSLPDWLGGSGPGVSPRSRKPSSGSVDYAGGSRASSGGRGVNSSGAGGTAWERDVSPLGSSQKRPFSWVAGGAAEQAGPGHRAAGFGPGRGQGSGFGPEVWGGDGPGSFPGFGEGEGLGLQVGQHAMAALAGLRLVGGAAPEASECGMGGMAGRGSESGAAGREAGAHAWRGSWSGEGTGAEAGAADPLLQLQHQLAQQRIDQQPAASMPHFNAPHFASPHMQHPVAWGHHQPGQNHHPQDQQHHNQQHNQHPDQQSWGWMHLDNQQPPPFQHSMHSMPASEPHWHDTRSVAPSALRQPHQLSHTGSFFAAAQGSQGGHCSEATLPAPPASTPHTSTPYTSTLVAGASSQQLLPDVIVQPAATPQQPHPTPIFLTLAQDPAMPGSNAAAHEYHGSATTQPRAPGLQASDMLIPAAQGLEAGVNKSVGTDPGLSQGTRQGFGADGPGGALVLEPQVSVQEVLAGVQRLLTGAGIKCTAGGGADGGTVGGTALAASAAASASAAAPTPGVGLGGGWGVDAGSPHFLSVHGPGLGR